MIFWNRLNDKIEELTNELNKKPVVVENVNPENYALEGFASYLGLNGRVNYKRAYEEFLNAEKKGSIYAKVMLAQ